MAVNGSNNVVTSAVYDAYGRVLSGTAFLGWVGRWGYFVEPNTGGIIYVRQRGYNGWYAAWLSPDRLGFVDGPNLYQYVGGNPVMGIDPSGLLVTCCGVGGFGGFWVAGSISRGQCWDDCGSPAREVLCAGIGIGYGGGAGFGCTYEPGCITACYREGGGRGHGQINTPWFVGGDLLIDDYPEDSSIFAGGGWEVGPGFGGSYTFEWCKWDVERGAR
jgi:RHS repeat-associated protein